MKRRVHIETLGCRVNQYESAAVAAELEKAGFLVVDDGAPSDLYVVNTCAVTAESERKSRQIVRRATSENPRAGVIVMGCYSQLKAEEAASLLGVIGVLGNRNKKKAAEIAKAFFAGNFSPVCETPDVETAPLEPMSITHTENARAFVKIEDGCDNKCAYCIIKTARGNVVSRLICEVCAEVRALVAAGYREMVLTGIETASYGKDTGETLVGLIAAVAGIDGVERIRLGSLEPSVLTPELVDFLASEPKFMPSLHLSLQSGSSTVLARMRRRYNAEQARARIAYLKEKMPAVTLTCDLIVGFPGETEEEFLETCELARFAGFLHMHVFPFSAREGTEAAEMPGQIAKNVKTERAARLSRIGDELARRVYESHANYIGNVLWETYENGVNHGHTETMLEAAMPGNDLRGQIVRVRCKGIENRTLICERE